MEKRFEQPTPKESFENRKRTLSFKIEAFYKEYSVRSDELHNALKALESKPGYPEARSSIKPGWSSFTVHPSAYMTEEDLQEHIRLTCEILELRRHASMLLLETLDFFRDIDPGEWKEITKKSSLDVRDFEIDIGTKSKLVVGRLRSPKHPYFGHDEETNSPIDTYTASIQGEVNVPNTQFRFFGGKKEEIPHSVATATIRLSTDGVFQETESYHSVLDILDQESVSKAVETILYIASRLDTQTPKSS